MYNLFLDDERVPYSPHGSGIEDAFNYTQNIDYVNLDWFVVRSFEEFVAYIEKNGTPQLISFDHDLADEHYQYLLTQNDVDYTKYKEKTGMECVKWLCDYCLDNDKKFPKHLIHTQNIIGGKNMLEYIKNFNKFYG